MCICVYFVHLQFRINKRNGNTTTTTTKCWRSIWYKEEPTSEKSRREKSMRSFQYETYTLWLIIGIGRFLLQANGRKTVQQRCRTFNDNELLFSFLFSFSLSGTHTLLLTLFVVIFWARAYLPLIFFFSLPLSLILSFALQSQSPLSEKKKGYVIALSSFLLFIDIFTYSNSPGSFQVLEWVIYFNFSLWNACTSFTLEG